MPINLQHLAQLAEYMQPNCLGTEGTPIPYTECEQKFVLAVIEIFGELKDEINTFAFPRTLMNRLSNYEQTAGFLEDSSSVISHRVLRLIARAVALATEPPSVKFSQLLGDNS